MSTTAQKTLFSNIATKAGVSAGYSGKQSAMFVSGDVKKVKSFIRVQCLKGKAAYPFAIKMGSVIS